MSRLEEIVAGAHGVFAARGYRRTQMADVAETVGVSPGTIYNYVEGKEALFALVLRWSLEERLPDPLPGDRDVAGAVAWLLERVGPDADSLLGAALQRRRAPADPLAELRGIVDEMYDRIVRFRAVLALLEGSGRGVRRAARPLRRVPGRRVRGLRALRGGRARARARAPPRRPGRVLAAAHRGDVLVRVPAPARPPDLGGDERRAKAAVFDLATHAFAGERA